MVGQGQTGTSSNENEKARVYLDIPWTDTQQLRGLNEGVEDMVIKK